MMIATYPDRASLYAGVLPRGLVGAELGVELGENAKCLLEVTHPSKLFLVDVWEDRHPNGQKFYDAVSRHFAGDARVSVVRDWTTSWLQSIPDGFLDWVYVDTLHSYDMTTTELLLLRTKVTQVIAGHDLVCTSPLLGWPASEWGGGVLLAMIEQIQAGWLKLIAITLPTANCSPQDMYPSWACRLVRP